MLLRLKENKYAVALENFLAKVAALDEKSLGEVTEEINS